MPSRLTLANSKFGDKPNDERLPLLLDEMSTIMRERFDRLSIQISEQSSEIKRIPAAVREGIPVGQTKSDQSSAQWVLTGKQERLIADRMAFYAPQNPTSIITSLIGDAASYTFASSLATAFKAAGWKLTEPSGFAKPYSLDHLSRE